MKTMTATEYADRFAAEKAAGLIVTLSPATDVVELSGDWDIEEEEEG